MNLPQILDDIHAIDSLLAGFEQRYGLLSDTFFAQPNLPFLIAEIERDLL